MADQTRMSPIARAFVAIGAAATGTLEHVGSIWFLLADAAAWFFRALTHRKIRVGAPAIIAQMVRVGANSIFIVSLVSGSIGFILGFQMAPPLDDLGQVGLVPNIIAVAVLRELGPLVAAIVLVGFAGAAIAAEIGTMVVGEEIEALEAHALNPVRFLVVPRVCATVLSMICLAVISNYVAVMAAAVMSMTVLGIPWSAYLNSTVQQVGPKDFMTGLCKAAIFGLLIGIIACANGLRVTGGAAGVGRATTQTVVQSVVAVIFADLIFTIVFYALKLF